MVLPALLGQFGGPTCIKKRMDPLNPHTLRTPNCFHGPMYFVQCTPYNACVPRFDHTASGDRNVAGKGPASDRVELAEIWRQWTKPVLGALAIFNSQTTESLRERWQPSASSPMASHWRPDLMNVGERSGEAAAPGEKRRELVTFGVVYSDALPLGLCVLGQKDPHPVEAYRSSLALERSPKTHTPPAIQRPFIRRREPCCSYRKYGRIDADAKKS